MRSALIAAAVAAVAGCTPEIGAGTYYCGPEMFCPPDLACDPNTFTCETPGSFEEFSCPDGSESNEPMDDAVSTAPGLGRLGCNYTSQFGPMCIDDFSDVDLMAFEIGACAGGDPHIEVEVRFPVGLAPLELDVLDEGEVVVGSGELCTPETNVTGREWLCVRIPPVEGTYFIRVRARGDIDCGGDCRFNVYELYVRYPLA